MKKVLLFLSQIKGKKRKLVLGNCQDCFNVSFPWKKRKKTAISKFKLTSEENPLMRNKINLVYK